MKYKEDFITNSSSASFVCKICNKEYTGWDWDDDFFEVLKNKICWDCEDTQEINISDFLIFLSKRSNLKLDSLKQSYIDWRILQKDEN